METVETSKDKMKIGINIQITYSNGKLGLLMVVSKITEKSCFLNYDGNETRYSWNTVRDNLNCGYFVIKP